MNKTSIILGAIIVIILVGIIYVFYQASVQKPGQDIVENNTNQNNNSNNFEIQGMKIEILKEGAPSESGKGAKTGDTVSVHYVGTIAISGRKFDSSIDRG